MQFKKKFVILYQRWQEIGSIAQLGEHLPYKQGVIGSSPIVPTKTSLNLCGNGSVVERCLAKANVASSNLVSRSIFFILRRYSQAVRPRSAKPSFPGSNPGGASRKSNKLKLVAFSIKSAFYERNPSCVESNFANKTQLKLSLDIKRMKHKKQRGQRKKIKNLLLNIAQITSFTNINNKYEHFHVPSDKFISSPKTSGKIKTVFCRAWLQKTADIIEKKPKDIPFCKVVSVVDEGNLWESQIIIFYDEEYYNSFWERSSTEQKWLPIDFDKRSFAKERNIKTLLKEKGYIEILFEEGIQRKSTLWFYGEI